MFEHQSRPFHSTQNIEFLLPQQSKHKLIVLQQPADQQHSMQQLLHRRHKSIPNI